MAKAPKTPPADKAVEALTYPESKRKNIPTAEYQAMLAKACSGQRESERARGAGALHGLIGGVPGRLWGVFGPFPGVVQSGKRLRRKGLTSRNSRCVDQ